jgi:hypothetical protein
MPDQLTRAEWLGLLKTRTVTIPLALARELWLTSRHTAHALETTLDIHPGIDQAHRTLVKEARDAADELFDQHLAPLGIPMTPPKE